MDDGALRLNGFGFKSIGLIHLMVGLGIRPTQWIPILVFIVLDHALSNTACTTYATIYFKYCIFATPNYFTFQIKAHWSPVKMIRKVAYKIRDIREVL